MELLQGKTAIAPGGTRGVGLAVVRVFLQNGARVALFGSRQETADRAVAALKSEEPGWDVIGLAPDLTDFASGRGSAGWISLSTTRASPRVNRWRTISRRRSRRLWI